MAFFNLTHLGAQDPFRRAGTASGDVQFPPQHSTESQQDTDESEPPQQQCSTQQTPEESSTVDNRDTAGQAGAEQSSCEQAEATSLHTGQMYSSAAATSWHKGSHTKYTELLRKHQRNPKGA